MNIFICERDIKIPKHCERVLSPESQDIINAENSYNKVLKEEKTAQVNDEEMLQSRFIHVLKLKILLGIAKVIEIQQMRKVGVAQRRI